MTPVKLTLHNPPPGYSAEAEYKWIDNSNGEVHRLESDGTARRVAYSMSCYGIILTPLPPPEPKWRAWRNRDEVPAGDVRFIRWPNCSVWFMPFSFSTDGVFVQACGKYTYSLLFDGNAEWSSDGKTWHRCGVEEQA